MRSWHYTGYNMNFPAEYGTVPFLISSATTMKVEILCKMLCIILFLNDSMRGVCHKPRAWGYSALI